MSMRAVFLKIKNCERIYGLQGESEIRTSGG